MSVAATATPADCPRHVAIVYDRLAPHSLGGAERYYWALARGLAERGPVTYVTCRYGDASRERRDGVELVGLAPARHGSRLVRDRMLPKLGFAAAVWWHFRRHGGTYDVVHCACFPHLALVATSLGLRRHRATKLVADWHEVIPREAWRRRLGAVGELGYLAQRLAIPAGDAAITFSRLHRDRLRAERRGEPIRVLPEFPPDGHIEPPTPAVARDPLIVFAGRLAPEKRAHLALAALAALRREDPAWRLEIFGVGPEESRLRHDARRLGLDGAVRFAGFAPWPELSAALARARTLMAPTRREGFGLIVLEAAAHGLPVILVREPDNAAVELVDPGVNGWICGSADPGELAAAVTMLAGDADIHDKTSTWYRQAARVHSLPNALTQLDALHGELGCRGRGPGSASGAGQHLEQPRRK